MKHFPVLHLQRCYFHLNAFLKLLSIFCYVWYAVFNSAVIVCTGKNAGIDVKTGGKH